MPATINGYITASSTLTKSKFYVQGLVAMHSLCECRDDSSNACSSPLLQSKFARSAKVPLLCICILLRHTFYGKLHQRTTLDHHHLSPRQANTTIRCSYNPPAPSQHHSQSQPTYLTTPPLSQTNNHAIPPPLAQALQTQTQAPRNPPPPPRKGLNPLRHHARRLQLLERNGFRPRLDQTHQSLGDLAREYRYRAVAVDERCDCCGAQVERDSS